MKWFLAMIGLMLWILVGVCIIPYIDSKLLIMLIGGILGVIIMAINMVVD